MENWKELGRISVFSQGLVFSKIYWLNGIRIVNTKMLLSAVTVIVP